jgi:hypothetical protein
MVKHGDNGEAMVKSLCGAPWGELTDLTPMPALVSCKACQVLLKAKELLKKE